MYRLSFDVLWFVISIKDRHSRKGQNCKFSRFWFTIFGRESDSPPSYTVFVSHSVVHHASLISPLQQNKKPRMPNFRLVLNFGWKEKLKRYGWQKSCSEISDVKNDRERYCHFGALRAPRWLITANFILYYTFTFYHFTGDNFHFSSLSISLILPLTTFTFHQFHFSIILPVTTFLFHHFHVSLPLEQLLLDE